MLELPMKDLLRIDEVGTFFSVSDRTIRLWAEHGHLEAVKIVGSIRITRESALKCRFGVRKDADLEVDQVIDTLIGGGSLPIDKIENPISEEENPEPPIEVAPVKRGRPKVKTEDLSL